MIDPVYSLPFVDNVMNKTEVVAPDFSIFGSVRVFGAWLPLPGSIGFHMET